MAVQAQYPSNILLLNRNGQEGHDFSVAPQPGGVFVDQPSSMTFNNNPRKRGRETSINNNTNNLFSQPQLIDISQLHTTNVVSTGLRLSFGEQQQQQQLQQQQQQQQLTQTRSSSSSSSSSLLSVLATQDFASQIKQQRDELELFLLAQGEQLRRTLAEKRERHYRALLGAAEESLARRLGEKEGEVEKATRRNAELEARAAQLGVEAQLWQAKARAQEATVASLQAQLQQAMVMGRPAHDGNDGGVSSAGDAEDAESAYVDPDRVASGSTGPSCRACRKRVASVVLLPCRHLSLCTECDRVVRACPVCHALKNSSVEVFLC